MEIPEELKYLAPYIQRGQELDNREPIVAYYAYYYAVKLAISRGPSNKTTNAYLSQLLDSLEVKKQALGSDNEAIKDDLVGYAHVENFALKVFLNADNEDRAGRATKKTAKTFLAASVFLEILKTFGDLDTEVEGKIKYAKWKAADIIKALREGRVPAPGAPGEQENESNDVVMTEPTMTRISDADVNESQQATSPQPACVPPSISDFPSPPSNYTAPLPSSSPYQGDSSGILQPSPTSPSSTTASTTHHHHPQPPPSSDVTAKAPSPSQSFSATQSSTHTQHLEPAPQPKTILTPSSSIPQPANISTVTPSATTTTVGNTEIASAQKHAKWAISALNYEDINTARLQLLNALNDLGYNSQNNFGY
ncbi:Vta1 like-domain-containing protein [Halteromyces radiatus]|uniref:Vta1 like-domain-containing protein n=1 Tax=Halteromyces radiatus TaxID=101107 RepID=UPI00222072C2|nr:Vta1 like-domain-containing protein [Halteromyces radiatus]KAI8086102.1 Vta1 like-domain-containing protein [Halteromyces radiatus]